MCDDLGYAGCDVSKDHLDVCLQGSDDRCKQHRCRQRRFENTPEGHRKLIQWLSRGDRRVRIAVEATGNYSLDLVLALQAADRVELMLANPKATKKFAEAQMQRSKTDRLDAKGICEFAYRMPFVPWQPPEAEVLELRGIARRIQALTSERTRELCRLGHAKASGTTPPVVINDIEVNLRHLERRLEEMLRQALEVVHRHAKLQGAFEHLTSVGGIGDKSAVLLLPELMALPEGMTVRQWVAHAGLDPRKYESGRSVEKRDRISKVGNVRLRRALRSTYGACRRW